MIAQRITQFLEHLGLTPYQFEKQVGVSKNSIAIAIKNNTTIGSESLGKIFAKYPNINLEWLISGEGEMLKENCTNDLSSHEKPHLIKTPINTPITKSKDLGVVSDSENAHSTRQNPKPSPSTSPKEIELLYQIIAEKDKRIAEKDEFIKLQRTTIEILEVELARKSSHQKIKVHS